MALAGTTSRILCNAPNTVPRTQIHPRLSSPSWFHRSRISIFTVAATPPKKSSSSSRTGKFDSKNRRTSPLTTKEQENIVENEGIAEMAGVGDGSTVLIDDGFVMPVLPGEKSDFWEGPQFDGLGFFVEYMWAFGILFALIACGIAVATFNEGATDFKETPAYKESIKSQELFEGPDASNSDVFESNPTEQAPLLE